MTYAILQLGNDNHPTSPLAHGRVKTPQSLAIKAFTLSVKRVGCLFGKKAKKMEEKRAWFSLGWKGREEGELSELAVRLPTKGKGLA